MAERGMSDRCPCRKVTEPVAYMTCCGRYHGGTATAPTAEALMRSRYCAYVRGDTRYLMATWHPSTRPADIRLDDSQGWVMLKVHAAHETGDTATVRFTARWRRGGQTGALSETSRFVRENGQWLYVDGDVAP
jgi:SEC-C motif-containing protein